MKLLRFKIGSLSGEKQFRSLYAGFEICFNNADENDVEDFTDFNPFCLVGLNGTGKSNVLEALATVFFHLECCVAKFRPDNFWIFRPEVCHPDAFELEYLILRKGEEDNIQNLDWVKIVKKENECPQMFVCPWKAQNKNFESISLLPKKKDGRPVSAAGKIYLPDIIIGYSSGENELLSVPFLKSRLINFDKYKEDFSKNYAYEEPENSLIYIDQGMSQAVLLACILFEEPESSAILDFFRKELGLQAIVSFRMSIHNRWLQNTETHQLFPVLEHIKDIIEKFKAIATSWNEQHMDTALPGESASVLVLDFWINEEIRKAFRSLFDNSFDCFRFFQVLYELNYYVFSDSLKQEVYSSKGVYTNGKTPVPGHMQDVFHFLDFLILKETKDGINKELLLQEFSDGEHQFLHTMGTCLMLKTRRCLMLLDEPETHFNPEWRSKFIRILSNSIKASGGNNLLKEILITSHSAFIISDCIPEKVIIFETDEEGKVQPQKAIEKGYKTYGTSVNLLTSRIFKEKYTIGKYAFDTLESYRRRLENGEPLEHVVAEMNEVVGDSIEKIFLIRQFATSKKND